MRRISTFTTKLSAFVRDFWLRAAAFVSNTFTQLVLSPTSNMLGLYVNKPLVVSEAPLTRLLNGCHVNGLAGMSASVAASWIVTVFPARTLVSGTGTGTGA